jgi:surfactin synthase thioesterase subunit
LPYAGGSESIYYKWQKHLDSSIKLEPIELKGRGRRCNEDFYESFDEAIDDIFLNIKDKVTHHEYAIFGHSMGSRLAYELYYKICAENFIKPKHIFFSGNTAPSIIREKKELHKLSDDEFMKEIFDLGGTPKEVIENRELLQVVRPILRNDMKIYENYIYEEKNEKIGCDMLVFSGKEEGITLEELLGWKKHAAKGFKVHILEGNHFFINDNVENITNIINSVLYKYVMDKGDQYVMQRN